MVDSVVYEACNILCFPTRSGSTATTCNIRISLACGIFVACVVRWWHAPCCTVLPWSNPALRRKTATPRNLFLEMAFKGKVVLITGASSGIGAATALYFSRLGASLALTGRNADNLNKVAAQCQEVEHALKPYVYVADLNNETETKNVLESTVKHYGKLDVLVNNAGVLETGSIEHTSLEQYDRMFNTNVRSVFHLTMLAIPYLTETKGNIINVSSVNGIRSFPGVLPYCMSKAAVDHMTRCVALEVASKQIRVNSVNPGVILTELQKRGGMDEETYAKFLQRAKETHALGRPGEPHEVARAIAFLASDDASFITGVNLPVDGGRHAMCPR